MIAVPHLPHVHKFWAALFFFSEISAMLYSGVIPMKIVED